MLDLASLPSSHFNPTADLKPPLTVKKLYDYFYLHPILCQHMWRVTSLMEKLILAWTGESKLPKQLLLETMLLHDLGNLIKFDLNPDAPNLLMKPEELDFYAALQAIWHEKFGHEVDEVTCQLINELPLRNGDLISQIILKHTTGTLSATVTNHDWLQKLCDYTDFRIGPFGMVTLAERFADLKNRYAYRHPDWMDPVKIAQRLTAFQELEAQLQTQVSCQLQELTDQDLGKIQRWESFRFETN